MKFDFTIHPRKPLYPWEKRKLEKEFAKEIPIFTDYVHKKHSLQNTTFITSLGSAACAFLWGSKVTFQPITGAYMALLTGVAVGLTTQVVGRYFKGLTSYNHQEYERAFNLFAYYKDRRKKTLPIDTAEQRYKEELANFRASIRKEYEKMHKPVVVKKQQ